MLHLKNMHLKTNIFISFVGLISGVPALADGLTNTEILAAIENGASNDDLSMNLNFTIAIASLLISSIIAITMYFVSLKGGRETTKEESRLTRSEIKDSIWRLEEKNNELIISNKDIKSDTRTLHDISSNINNQLNYILLNNKSDFNPQQFRNNIMSEVSVYEELIKALKIENDYLKGLHSDKRELHSYLNTISDSLIRLNKESEFDRSDLSQIKFALKKSHDKIDQLASKSIDAERIESIIEDSMSSLVFSKPKKTRLNMCFRVLIPAAAKVRNVRLLAPVS